MNRKRGKDLNLNKRARSLSNKNSTVSNQSNPVKKNLNLIELLKNYTEISLNQFDGISNGIHVRYLVRGTGSEATRFRRGGIIQNKGTTNKGDKFLYAISAEYRPRSNNGWKIMYKNVERIWILNSDLHMLSDISNVPSQLPPKEEIEISPRTSSMIPQLTQRITPQTSPETFMHDINMADQISEMRYLHENYMKTMNKKIQQNHNDFILLSGQLSGLIEEVRKVEETIQKIALIMQNNGLLLRTK